MYFQKTLILVALVFAPLIFFDVTDNLICFNNGDKKRELNDAQAMLDKPGDVAGGALAKTKALCEAWVVHTEFKGEVVSDKKPIFVVHKHYAKNLHYDFRLEIDGVLKSWAIPKGPSTDPEVKRLAILTEDHSMSYANFEGEIPQGHYGAGSVEIWDEGTFSNLKSNSLEECFKNGLIEVNLEGKKLKGAFALIKFKNAGNDEWIFKKVTDKSAV